MARPYKINLLGSVRLEYAKPNLMAICFSSREFSFTNNHATIPASPFARSKKMRV